MTDDERSLLAPLRGADPGPESRVSVADAIRSGRRIRRRHTALGAAAAAVLTAFAVLLVPAVLRDQPEQLQVTNAPSEFDLFWQQAKVGSAGGFTPYRYQTERYLQRIELKRAGAPDPATPVASVTLYPRGRLPDVLNGRSEPDSDGDTALGEHPGRWTRTPTEGPDRVEYAWQWAPGAWAFASVPAADPDARAEAYRVAESVDLSTGVPVRTPFTVPGDTALPVTGTVSAVGNADLKPSVALVYGQDTVRVGARACGGQRPETSLGGRSAVVTDRHVLVFGLTNGLCAFTSTTDPVAVPSAELTRRAVAVEAAGDPADPGTWSANPVRGN